MREDVIKKTIRELPKERFVILINETKGDVRTSILTFGAESARLEKEEIKQQIEVVKKYGLEELADIKDLEKVYRAILARMISRL